MLHRALPLVSGMARRGLGSRPGSTPPRPTDPAQNARAVLAVAIAYLLGSVPTGYLVARVVTGVDIREVGGHYTGAGNVLREVGPAAAALTLAVDVLKGALSVLQVRWLALPEPAIIPVGLAAVAGHIWPAFLQFRGGAGFATLLGVLMAALPRQALILFLPFTVMVGLLKGTARLAVPSALLLPALLILSRKMGESTARTLLPLFVGALVTARVYREPFGSLARRLVGAAERS